MAKPIDGVIEAVRYKNGQIACARAYERRGSAYSDCMVLDRKTLIERLQKGKQFAIGSRTALLGGTFRIGKPVLLVKHEGRDVLATRENAARDDLEGAPYF